MSKKGLDWEITIEKKHIDTDRRVELYVRKEVGVIPGQLSHKMELFTLTISDFIIFGISVDIHETETPWY